MLSCLVFSLPMHLPSSLIHARVLSVLVGNKCDLESERQVSTAEGAALAAKWHECAFFETSARLKVNNEVCFFELVRAIRKQAKADQASKGASDKKKKSKCVIL